MTAGAMWASRVRTELRTQPQPRSMLGSRRPAGAAHSPVFLATCRVLHFGMQVVEISSLTEHLLTECDKKDGFGKCYRCSEAILKEELPRHIKTKECNRECLLRPLPGPLRALCVCSVLPAGRDTLWRGCPGLIGRTKSCFIDTISAAKPEKLANRCPLCHENFSPGEEVRVYLRQ